MKQTFIYRHARGVSLDMLKLLVSIKNSRFSADIMDSIRVNLAVAKSME